MKIKLLFFLLIPLLGFAQPQIEGDTMLCPFTNGTAYVVNDQNYDSYTWYWKYWFSGDAFQAVPGATGAQFTYDWYTYDQALIKVVVTLNGETFESNTIQIDSYAWTGLVTGFQDSDNISIDPNNGNVMLCAGTTFMVEVYNPYTIVQWYRDGVAIPEATSMTFEISGPGNYHVVAAPGFCPDSSSSSEGTPITVVIDNDCQLGVDNPTLSDLRIFPNPVKDVLTISGPDIEMVNIYNMTGQLIFREQHVNSLDVSTFPVGVYLLEVQSGTQKSVRKFVKE